MTQSVSDHNDHTYWCEIQVVDEKRSRVRLMRRWHSHSPDIVWTSRKMSHAKAAAKVDKTMARLSKKYEGWER